jgi:phage tail-like protein
MQGDRGVALVASPDQWARCSHRNTALAGGGLSGVELALLPPRAAGASAGSPDVGPSGLTFDRWCRAYRSRPDRGRVQAIPGGSAEAPGALRAPHGLTIDVADRLYVTETGRHVVHVVDLRGQRLLRRVPVRGPGRERCRPVDVAAAGSGALVLCQSPAVLLRIEGRRGPLPGPLLRRPRGAGPRPLRVAVRGGSVLVLWAGRGGGPAVVADPDGRIAVRVPGGTDLELTSEGVLVVATGAGNELRRFGPAESGWDELPPLSAPGHDGGALALAPNGRLAFTAADGYAWTAGTRAEYLTSGLVTGYRLDAGAYRTRWGRIFVDACVPSGTSVRVYAITSDDDAVADPVPWTPPRGAAPPTPPEPTPLLPSAAAVAALPLDGDRIGRLFRRPGGAERPWASPDPEGLATYEAPVLAPPGRYLWLLLQLAGNGRVTPRVREVRVERPGHRLATALPPPWSAHEGDAAFLQHFLEPAEGLLHELDERAALRAFLLDPGITPPDALPWLASLLGLALDARWPESARRELLRQAYDLYRIRGTQQCLDRLLRLYLPEPVAIVENWRLRGVAGAVLGMSPTAPSAPAVGGPGAAGALGRFIVGGQRPGENGYTATAHRFTVLICADLTSEQRDVVRGLLESHKPAHTRVELCELGTGMRVGRRLHLGLSSVVGPGDGWGDAVVGQVAVGGNGVVGLPAVGDRVGSARVPEVRVG